MRQVFLDTETTGFSPKGDRIIEIGAVEAIDRKVTGNNYHQFINPNRSIPEAVVRVHGITDPFLVDKPAFKEIVSEFLEFIAGAEVIIHNAKFDVGFINAELERAKIFDPRWNNVNITDSLAVAKKKYPGGKVSLDALCKKLKIDNTDRTLHGALLDSEILAEVYLTMTGGQRNLKFEKMKEGGVYLPKQGDFFEAPVIKPLKEEEDAHKEKLEFIKKETGTILKWPN